MTYQLSPYVTIHVAVLESADDSVVTKPGPPIQPLTIPVGDLEGCKLYDELLLLPAQVEEQVVNHASPNQNPRTADVE